MKKYRKIIILILFMIIAGCLAYIVYYYVKKEENEQVYDRIREEVVQTEPEETESGLVIPIDFAALQSQNPDVYAWIRIDDTNIDYPVLQSETDNEYYLNHTIDGTEGYPGSIYTENWNSKNFTDYNTVIYGHEMRDGTMFHDLLSYADMEYMTEHPEIVIYTPDKKFTYEIFAYVEFDDRHILHSFDFAFRQGRQKFLDELQNARSLNNQFREDVEVTADDRLLTLSTCKPGYDDKRILVEAVLTNEES